MDDRSFMYEIFRACRLCGGGGGYKMPIVTNLPLEGSDVELRHKINECVHIEVLEDDHMPPLICELCVDKINEYYEFLELCRLTNKNTRSKLGLPMESTVAGAIEDDNCILGTEDTPVFTRNYKEKSGPKSQSKAVTKPVEPKSVTRPGPKPGPKSKDVKKVGRPGPASKKRHVTPPPEVVTRSSRSSSLLDVSTNSPTRGQKEKSYQLSDEIPLKRMKKHNNERESSNEDLTNAPTTRGANKDKSKANTGDEKRTTRQGSDNQKEEQKASKIIRKNKSQEEIIPPKRVTRHRSDDIVLPDKDLKFSSNGIPKGINIKELKVEIEVIKEKQVVKPQKVKAESPPPVKKIKPSPKSVKAATPPPVKSKSTHKCSVCNTTFKAQQYLNLHLHAHCVNFTSNKLACNACRDWFVSPMEMGDHHKWHEDGNAYSCKQCYDDFDVYADFIKHIETDKCIPLYEVSDIKCDDCWQMFPTLNLLNLHDCEGEEGRPGGNCYRCKKSCFTQKILKKHETSCTFRPKVQGVYVDPKIHNNLKEVRVRTSRCDSLLQNRIKRHYNIANVKNTFGLDKNCEYPFMTALKRIPFNGMVNIGDEFFDLDNDFVHWDSDTDEENDINTKKNVPTLFHLAIKKIYSKNLLGKVPKKRKKIKTDIDKAQSLLDFFIADDEITNVNDGNKKTNGFNDINKAITNKNTDKFKIKSILSEKFENDELTENGFNELLDDKKEKIGVKDLISEENSKDSKEFDSIPEDINI